MKRDWTGNNKSTYSCIGATNHTKFVRPEYDYYATDPKAAELLLEVEPDLCCIWECACGNGHLAEVFEKNYRLVQASDIVKRGYKRQDFCCDFLKYDKVWHGDIVTNPPYKYATEFVKKALSLVDKKKKVCMFLKLTFLEGKGRKEFFKQNPPRTIYVCSERIKCAKNGDFDENPSSAIAYAWFIWEKGFMGKSVIEWIN